jgi:diacylglycerol kinase
MTRIGFIDSVLCASRGVISSISKERNIKIQILLCSIIIFFSLLLEISKTSLITIIIVCFLVIILEMFNKGFEKLVDFVSPEYNKEAGRIKDIMAGVVLLTFIMTAIVGFLILYNPFIHFINQISKNNFLLFSLISLIFLVSIIIIIKLIKDKITK